MTYARTETYIKRPDVTKFSKMFSERKGGLVGTFKYYQNKNNVLRCVQGRSHVERQLSYHDDTLSSQ